MAANDAVSRLLDGVDPGLLEPPVNVIRLTLDPAGLAPRIVNLAEWRAHLLGRLRREHDASATSACSSWCAPTPTRPTPRAGPGAPSWWCRCVLRVGTTSCRFLSATTVFGTPREVTLSELAIEAFSPADDATRAGTGRELARARDGRERAAGRYGG